MTRRLSLGCALAAAALEMMATAARAQPTPGSTPATFSGTIDVNLVNLDVHVEDKTGAPLTDLTLDDFEVLENGKKVEVRHLARYGSAAPDPEAELQGSTPDDPGSRPESSPGSGSATAPAPPLRLAVLVDLDNSRPADRQRILVALQSFLSERGSSPSVMVLSYSLGGVKVVLPFSRASEEWSRALETTFAGAARTAQRELEEQQILADIGEALKEVRVDRSMAQSLLQGVIARAQHYATGVSHDSRALIEALENLSSALAALPGPKSLLYVGDGFAMRPGAEVFDLLSRVFEDDRRFGDRSAVATAGSDASGSASEGGTAGGDRPSSGAAVVSMPPRTTSPLLRGGMPGLDLTRDVEALTAAANSQRVTFYAVSSMQAGGLGSRADIGRGAKIAATRADTDSPSGLSVFEGSRLAALQESLDYTAEATGGLAAAAGADVGRFLDRMWSHSTSYYSLAYPVPDPEDGGLRRIKVKVRGKGVRVRHREAYVAKPREARIGDLLAGALLLRTGENPHRLETGLAAQEAGADGAWRVSLGLRIPIGELDLVPAGDAHRADLQVYVLTMDERGRLSKVQFAPLSFAVRGDELDRARDRPFVATFPLVLERGSHQIAVGLSEAVANRLSVARTTLEIGSVN